MVAFGWQLGEPMGRKSVASPERSSATGHDPSALWASRLSRPFGFRLLVLGVVLLGLLVVITFALVREASTPNRATISAPSPPPLAPPRPPFTRAEEAYIKALWPIHGAVERSTVRMSLGQIFYTINDMSRTELKPRVDDALATYRQAESRLRGLQPPPSLQGAHDDYLAAVRLFQKSAAEVLRVFEDGNDDHLRTAYPLNQEASNKIREVGAKFWPNEFVPN